jgi:hypothetical protein
LLGPDSSCATLSVFNSWASFPEGSSKTTSPVSSFSSGVLVVVRRCLRKRSITHSPIKARPPIAAPMPIPALAPVDKLVPLSMLDVEVVELEAPGALGVVEEVEEDGVAME